MSSGKEDSIFRVALGSHILTKLKAQQTDVGAQINAGGPSRTLAYKYTSSVSPLKS